MSRNEAIENIIQYFKANEGTFDRCIEELDSYNGYLGDDRYYEMYDLPELLSGTPIDTLLNMAYLEMMKT